MKEETTIVVNSDTVQNTVDKVENALSVLADKLGVASDHFYPILTKQYVIEGYLWLLAAAPLLLLATFLSYVSIEDIIKKGEQSEMWPLAWFSLLLYIVFAATLALNVAQIINPEYYALKEIMSLVK